MILKFHCLRGIQWFCVYAVCGSVMLWVETLCLSLSQNTGALKSVPVSQTLPTWQFRQLWTSAYHHAATNCPLISSPFFSLSLSSRQSAQTKAFTSHSNFQPASASNAKECSPVWAWLPCCTISVLWWFEKFTAEYVGGWNWQQRRSQDKGT